MNKKVLYVGFNGFPKGFAQVERQRLISKGLLLCGHEVTVLNRYGVHKPESNIPKDGISEGIIYSYASGSSTRESSYVQRNLYKIKGLLNEITFIIHFFKNKPKQDNGALLITTNKFYNIVIYTLLARLAGVTSILDNVEHFSSIKRKKSFLKKVNDNLYDKFGHKLVTKVIGISDFLVNIAIKDKPDLSVLKIPAIVDFSIFQKADLKEGEPYFLYCGTLSYKEVIFFILEAFEKLTTNPGYYLYLVCSNGSKSDMETVQSRIKASSKSSYIRFFTGLPYKELVDLYVNSKALLIPLRNVNQDVARFPHKIGEYCASSSVIISTNVGEVKSYFADQVNALLCNEYDSNEFSGKMQFVIDNPLASEEIGKKGYRLGSENFDYIKLTRKISNFIS